MAPITTQRPPGRCALRNPRRADPPRTRAGNGRRRYRQTEHRQSRPLRLRGTGASAPGHCAHLPDSEATARSRALERPARPSPRTSAARGAQGVDAERIFIGNGVSELIDISLRALLQPGDEVLLPSPDYPLWSAATVLNGGRPRYYRCLAAQRPSARSGRDRRADHPAHARDRADQPEQPDRRGVPARAAGAHGRAGGAPRPAAARPTRSTTTSSTTAPIRAAGATGRRRALPELWRPVQGAPRLRLPHRLDEPVRRSRAHRRACAMRCSCCAALRLCANVPAQWAVRAGTGGCPTPSAALPRPGGRLHEARRAVLDGVGRQRSSGPGPAARRAVRLPARARRCACRVRRRRLRPAPAGRGRRAAGPGLAVSTSRPAAICA